MLSLASEQLCKSCYGTTNTPWRAGKRSSTPSCCTECVVNPAGFYRIIERAQPCLSHTCYQSPSRRYSRISTAVLLQRRLLSKFNTVELFKTPGSVQIRLSMLCAEKLLGCSGKCLPKFHLFVILANFNWSASLQTAEWRGLRASMRMRV